MIENFKKLIAKNPRIKSLYSLYSEREFIKFISENLRELDELKLRWKEDSHIPDLEDVHFESVKILSIGTIDCRGWNGRVVAISAPKNMYFKNIESLQAHSFYTNSNSWMDLVANATQLRTLHIETELNEYLLRQLSNRY